MKNAIDRSAIAKKVAATEKIVPQADHQRSNEYKGKGEDR